MRRAKRSSQSPRTVIERGDRVLSLEVPITAEFPGRTRGGTQDAVHDESRRQLVAAIDDALARARRGLNDALAQHGVRSLNITVSAVGGRSFDWDWSAQLNVVLDGKLLR